MARDLRTMNMTEGQKGESDEVMKRIGDLDFRNMGTISKIALFDQGDAVIVGSGLRVSPSSNMTVSIPSGACFQRISSGDVLACLQTTDQTVTMDAATGTPRTDIVEAQIQAIEDKDDTALTGSIVSGSVVVTNQAIKRDIKYFLKVQKSTNTTTPTAATAGILTGTIAIPGTIDLSTKSKINIQDGEDGSFIEIDCKGATPASTTRAEIIANINSGVGRTIASTGAGNVIVLTGIGTGQTSFFRLKPPSDTTTDATDLIFGLAIGGSYKYTYSGNNSWFKLAEIEIGAATTVITGTEIKDIDEKGTWATGASDILIRNTLFSNNFKENVIFNDRVGIGIDVPINTLHIKDSFAGIRLTSSTTGDTTGDGVFCGLNGSDDFVISQKENKYIAFETSSLERIRIDSSGKVGIGTETPDYLLEVEKSNIGSITSIAVRNPDNTNIASHAQLLIDSGGPSGGDAFTHYRVSGTTSFVSGIDNSDGDRFKINPGSTIGANNNFVMQTDGKIGINTSTPNRTLDVNGIIALPASTTETRNIEIGEGRSGNGSSFIDFIGDATYSDYGLRIARNNTGPNTTSQIIHRGTGDLDIQAPDGADIVLSTVGSASEIRLDANGGVCNILDDAIIEEDLNVNGETTTYDLVVQNSSVTVAGRPAYQCRAWVNFDGTSAGPSLTIRGSGNVTSVTDLSVGQYQVNITNPMVDTNYSVVGSALVFPASTNVPYVAGTKSTATTYAEVFSVNTSGAYSDALYFSVAIFR